MVGQLASAHHALCGRGVELLRDIIPSFERVDNPDFARRDERLERGECVHSLREARLPRQIQQSAQSEAMDLASPCSVREDQQVTPE
jgi:hypothetical protein